METTTNRRSIWRILLRIVIAAIAAVYVVVLVKIVLLKYGLTSDLRALQLVPFHFIQDFITPQTSIDVLLKNVLGNFAIFVPLGILLPVFFRKLTFWKTVLAGCLTSLAFELLQYAVGFGATDIDDLILNTLGCAAGAGLYFGLFCRKGNRLRAEVVSTVALAVFGCCGVLALWLYAPSELPRQVAYVNEAAFGDADPESYDLSASCTGIADGTVTLRSGSAQTGGEEQAAAALSDSYPLSADAVYIIARFTYQYSPNGNIQKTTVTYETVTAEAMDAAIQAGIAQHGGAYADLWLDADGACRLLCLTVYED